MNETSVGILSELGITTLQVIVKISERCNLSCTYCYYFFAGDETYKSRPPLMKEEVFEDLATFLSQAPIALGVKRILVAFHGGEPTLMKPEKLRMLCKSLRRAIGSVPLGFQMQTNGVLLDDEWLKLISEEEIQVGVSIDGPLAENDKFRIANNGDGTYDRTVGGIRLLQDAARTDLRISAPSSISVINPSFDYRRVFEHLHVDLGITETSFLFPDIQHDIGFANGVSAKRFGEIYVDIFEAWLSTGGKARVRFITEFLSYFQVMQPRLVEKAASVESGGRTQVIVVQSNGDISIDDTYMVALQWRMAQETPNVKKEQIGKYLTRPVFKEIRDAQSKLPALCAACEWRSVCKGGDLENRYSRLNGFNNPSIFCEGLKYFYSHVIRYLLENGYPRRLVEERLRFKWRETEELSIS